MEKLVITKYGRAVNFGAVQMMFTKTVNVFFDDNAERKVTPFAVFAIMENGEIVHIGSFSDMDIAEIIAILLDVFATDRKEIFNVSLEAHAIVVSAAESYKYTLMAVRNHTRSDSIYRRKEELETFFLSNWFNLLSGLDGRRFIEKMREVYYFDS